jgi:uncharacterized membrane protein
MTTPDAAEKLLGKTRIEALSDGVFAIAMTLLVLDLKTPDLPHRVASGELLRGLAPLGPSLFSFVMTFALAGAFWYQHHFSFHHVKYVNRGLCAINVVFLMFVSLLPFSGAMLGKFGPQNPVSVGLYFGNQLALGLVLNAHWVYARRRGLLTTVNDGAARFMIRVQPIACLLALALTAAAPSLSFYGFLATTLVGRRIARSRFKEPSALENGSSDTNIRNTTLIAHRPRLTYFT